MSLFKKLKNKLTGKDDSKAASAQPAVTQLLLCCDQNYFCGSYRAAGIAYDATSGLLAMSVVGGLVVFAQDGFPTFVRLPECAAACTAMTFVPSARSLVVAACQEGRLICVVDILSKEVILQHKLAAQASVLHFCNNPTSPYVFCLTSEGIVLILNAKTAVCCQHELKCQVPEVQGLAVHTHDESLLVLQTNDAVIQFCGLTNKPLITYQAEAEVNGALCSFCFTGDGKYIFATTEKGMLLSWRVRTEKRGSSNNKEAPVLAFPLPSGSTGVVGLTCVWQEAEEYVLYGYAVGFGALRARVGKGKQGLQCTTVECVSDSWGHSSIKQLIFLPSLVTGTAFHDPPCMAVLTVDGNLHLVDLLNPPSRTNVDAWEGLENSPAQECLLLPTITLRHTTLRHIGCWPVSDAERSKDRPLPTASLLLARCRAGNLLLWSYNPSSAELVPASLSPLEQLDGVTTFASCYGGLFLLCLCFGAAGLSLHAVNLHSGFHMVAWHQTALGSAYDKAPETDPRVESGCMDDPSLGTDPSSNSCSAVATLGHIEFVEEPLSTDVSSLCEPSSGGGMSVEEHMVPKGDMAPVEAAQGGDLATEGDKMSSGDIAPGRRTVEATEIGGGGLVHEGFDDVSTRETDSTPPLVTPATEDHCLAMCLAQWDVTKVLLAFSNRIIKVLSLPQAVPHNIDLLELIEVDVIRQVRDLQDEETVKSARTHILEVARTSEISMLDTAVCKRGARDMGNPLLFVMLLAMNKGMLYSIAYNSDHEVSIVGNRQVSAAGTKQESQNAPLLRPIKNPVNGNCARDGITLNAPVSAGLISIPSNFWVNLYFEPHVLVKARGVVEGNVHGLFSELIFWFRLCLVPSAQPLLKFGHTHLGGQFHAEVEVGGLVEEIAQLEPGEPVVLGISHDSVVGFYMVSLGTKTLFTEQYDSVGSTDFSVTRITVTHQHLPEDLATEETGIALHLPSVGVLDCLRRLEVCEGYTQDAIISCDEEYAAKSPRCGDEPHLADVCVAAYGAHLSVLSLPELSPKADRDTEADVLDFAPVHLQTRCCVVGLFTNGSVMVFDASNLRPLSKSLTHPLMGTNVRLTTISGSQEDGYDVVLVGAQGEGLQHWRLRGAIAGTDHHLTPERVQCPATLQAALDAAPDPAAFETSHPKPKRGFFESVFASEVATPAKFHALLSEGKSPSSLGERSPDFSLDTMRQELMGRHANQAKKPAQATGLSETRSVMGENAKMLEERGERLSELANKTAEMRDAAQDFSRMATKLRKQEQDKKWWEL